MPVDEVPIPLLPGRHIPPRQLEKLANWARCVCCLSTVLMLLEPDLVENRPLELINYMPLNHIC